MEAAARVLAWRVDELTFPVRSACRDDELDELLEYEAFAEVALTEVRCALVGRDCSCWTNERLTEVALRNGIARTAADRSRSDGAGHA